MHAVLFKAAATEVRLATPLNRLLTDVVAGQPSNVQLAYENRKLKDRAAHKESTAFESHFEAKVASQVEL
jgi:hypothetical protein